MTSLHIRIIKKLTVYRKWVCGLLIYILNDAKGSTDTRYTHLIELLWINWIGCVPISCLKALQKYYIYTHNETVFQVNITQSRTCRRSKECLQGMNGDWTHDLWFTRLTPFFLVSYKKVLCFMLCITSRCKYHEILTVVAYPSVDLKLKCLWCIAQEI